MKVKENCVLFDQFRHYGIDFLIPCHLNSDDDDEEGIAHSYKGENKYDLASEYDYCNDDDDENCDDDEDWNDRNIDDLLRQFDCDYLDYSEFLDSSVWDLFGVSKKQFDMIDWRWIVDDDFPDFYTAFTETYKDYPIEKRILYSTVQCLTQFRRMSIFASILCINSNELFSYLHRLIDTHDIPESRNLLGYLWDYYRFYSDAVEMDERREAQGESTFKYSPFPKPSHIKDIHDKAFRDHQVRETERMKEKHAELDAGIAETVSSPLYLRYLYTDKQYSVIGVKNQSELEVEGEILNHCVASYGSNLADGSSYIYFIRKSSELDVPYFTIELIPRERPQDKPVLKQCYTTDDGIDKPESLRRFIKEWCKRKSIKIGCEI